MGLLSATQSQPLTQGGLLGSAGLPAGVSSSRVGYENSLYRNSQQAQRESAQANSLGGMASNFGSSLMDNFNETMKSVVKGSAEFSLSAGEALPRLESGASINPNNRDISNAVLPPTNIPVISNYVGPVQSFQSQAAQRVINGENPWSAIGSGIVDTAINEPLGLGIKAAGLLGKAAIPIASQILKPLSKTLAKSPTIVDSFLNLSKYFSPSEARTLAPKVASETNPAKIEQILTESPSMKVVGSQGKSALDIAESHITMAKEILDATPNVPIKDLVANTEKEMIAGLQGEGRTAEADAISKIDTTGVNSLGELDTKVKSALTGGTPASIALDANRALAEKGFNALPEDQLASFGSINKAEVIQKAASLLSDKENLIGILKGDVPVPTGVPGPLIAKTAEAFAVKTGNGEILQALEESPLASETSIHAQQLGSAGYISSEDTVVKDMQSIRKARSARVTPTPKAPKSVIKATDWSKFIEDITC